MASNGELKGLSKSELRERVENSDFVLDVFQERLAELELALEDQGWSRLLGENEREFSRGALDEIVRQARMFYLKNPLIKRAVRVFQFYVFGQGMEVSSRNPQVNDVVQAFWDDPKNRAELTSHQAMGLKDVELNIAGNLFLTFFTTRKSGKVRVRSIPFHQLSDILTNPEDAKEPWFYKRAWTQANVDGSDPESKVAYYPDILHTKTAHASATEGHPADAHPTDKFEDGPIMWDNPVLHVKVGGTADMKFGVPEVYAALDWSKATTTDMENYITVKSALARFAFTLTRQGGGKAIAAAKAKLNTTINSGEGYGEGNPPPQTAAIFLQQARGMLEPVKTAGAQPHPEEGRTLRLMVSAATGIPETILMGDADVGNLATAQTLDRPTELQMKDRQTLWKDTVRSVLTYVLKQGMEFGELKDVGMLQEDDPGAMPHDEDTGEPLDASIEVNFPPILEHDPEKTISSITSIAPLGMIPERELARLAMMAFNLTHVDELLDEIYDKETGQRKEPLAPEGLMVQQPPWAQPGGAGGAAGEPAQPAKPAAAPSPFPGKQRRLAASARLHEALRELRNVNLSG